jgi:hypothetical protein
MRGIYRFSPREPKEGNMPAFNITIDNLSKMLCTVEGILQDDGSTTPLASMSVNIISGDGTVGLIDNEGNPLPPNKVYLVSGQVAGDTVYEFTLYDGLGRSITEQGVMTVTEVPIPPALVHGVYTFGPSEPK